MGEAGFCFVWLQILLPHIAEYDTVRMLIFLMLFYCSLEKLEKVANGIGRKSKMIPCLAVCFSQSAFSSMMIEVSW